MQFDILCGFIETFRETLSRLYNQRFNDMRMFESAKRKSDTRVLAEEKNYRGCVNM